MHVNTSTGTPALDSFPFEIIYIAHCGRECLDAVAELEFILILKNDRQTEVTKLCTKFIIANIMITY